MAEPITVYVNGRPHQFPAGTSKETIEKALKELYPTPTSEEKEAEAKKAEKGGLGRAFGSGVVKGTEDVLTLPDTIKEVTSKYVLDPLFGKAGIERQDPTKMPDGSDMPLYYRPFSRDAIGALYDMLTGDYRNYEAQGSAEKLVQAGGRGLPFGAIGGARAAVVEGLLPSVASEAAGQATEGSDIEPYARFAAGLLTPTAIESTRRIAATGGLAVPDPISPAQAERGAALEARGMEYTAGQLADDPVIMAREAATQAGREMAENQLEDFTSLALKEIGVDANRFTTEVSDMAHKKIGSVFNDLAAKSDIPVDAQLAQEVFDALQVYRGNVNIQNRAPAVAEWAKKLQEASKNNGRISGNLYNELTSKIRNMRQSDMQSTRDLANKLDEALQSSLGRQFERSGDADLLKQWGTARKDYANLKVIERASLGQSDAAMSGLITPKALYGAVKAKAGGTNVSRGRNTLAELARDAQGIAPLPQSGTAPRTVAEGILSTGGPAATGVAAALGTGGDLGQAMTAGTVGAGLGAASLLRNRMLNNLIAQPRGQEFLRQYMTGGGRPLVSPLPLGPLLTDNN